MESFTHITFLSQIMYICNLQRVVKKEAYNSWKPVACIICCLFICTPIGIIFSTQVKVCGLFTCLMY